ncbi:MAG: DUF169 domain-containing protein [Methanoregulaceae archaeon]|nr:DUF169 domain-containing protein [Methanoregulaceae archaeon]
MTDGPMKIPINYAETSEILRNALKLTGSPVAVRFALTKEDIPPGIEEIDKTQRHCSMVNLARKEGKIFFATASKHECNGGAWALGLREITPTLKSGDFYYKLGKFNSAAACKRTIDQIPHLQSGETYATIYAPLEKTPFTPHVVIMVANPWAMLKLAQVSLFRLGGRVESSCAGIQSVCSDACALPYISGKPNFSLGCDGSRKFSGIADDEMVIGIPGEMIPEFTQSIGVIVGAAGSKK